MSNQTTATQDKPGISPLLVLSVLAVMAVLVMVVLRPAAAWSGVLTGALFAGTIALGAAAVCAVSLLCGARWWDGIRRVPVALSSALPVPVLVLAVTIVAGLGSLYPWAVSDPSTLSHLVQEKLAWLNTPFFLGRTAFVLLSWIVLTAILNRHIRRAEALGVAVARPGLIRASIVFTLFFGLTISVGFWDWVMSMEPEWFSSIYGVYGFAATFRAGIAGMAILGIVLARRRLAGGGFRGVACQTLGALLFAFSMFWAYIWLSQYLLIWYADLPEESVYYLARLGGGWSVLFWLNPVLNFVIPFAILLPARTKEHPWLLLQVSVIALIGHWVDMLVLVAPATGPLTPIAPLAGILTAFACLVAMSIPIRRCLSSWDADIARTSQEHAVEAKSPLSAAELSG